MGDEFTIEQEMWGRDDVDKIVHKAGREIYTLAVGLGPMLWDAIVAASKKYRVDPTHVLHTLEYTSSRLSGKDKEAFQVAYALHLANPYQVPEFRGPIPEEDEARISLAGKDVIRWAKDDFIYEAAKITVAVAKRHAGAVQAAMAAMGDPVPRSQAAHVILTELPLRTRDHPYWFRDSDLLYRILDLFLDI